MSVHSYRVRDISATRSPGWIPAAIRPAAAARTWSASSRQVTGCQVPCSFRFRPTAPGQFSALAKRSSVTLSFGFTTYAAGTEISCIGAPDRRFSTLSTLTLGTTAPLCEGERSRVCEGERSRVCDGGLLLDSADLAKLEQAN